MGMEIDRRILVFDGPEGELQRLALDLIGRDFEVHYANDIDEAQILAHEAKGRINAVLFSSSMELERVPDMARRFNVSPAALIPIGPRPDDRVVAALAFHGVRWHLWDEPADESIRFVISSVLFEQDPLEIRYHRRVPTNLPARIEIDGAKSDTTIRDISLGGACLLGGLTGKEGDEGTLSFLVESEAVTIPSRIVWAVGDVGDPLAVAGLSFLEVDPAAGEAIDGLLEAVIARHRIEKRPGAGTDAERAS
ncbi:MAG TPA: PilZ domain-containing protein [Deltaproteobacteria bacterium]|nr:PilZ domain-containing protein [Deltaproteobacteria bacterium]